jgi:hypothetical protein
MGYIIDTAITTRIIYLLVTPFTKWPAYKDGIIDEDGNRLNKGITIPSSQKDDWTMLHRLVARLKRIIAIAPGGKSFLGTLTASYLLVRECLENDDTSPSHDVLKERFNTLSECVEEKDIQFVEQLLEDGEGGVTGVANASPGMGSMLKTDPTDLPPAPKNGSKKLKTPILGTVRRKLPPL